MFKKVRNNFWLGLALGIILSFIAIYFAWPKIPLDESIIKGEKIILPKTGEKAGIYYPLDGDKVNLIFLVYGLGIASETLGIVEITDISDQVIFSTPVHFQSEDASKTGQFIYLINLNQTENLPDNGKVNLYYPSPKDGKKVLIDSKNIRFK